MRPHEPDVTGPRNLDGITARATRNAGRSVTVAFDRRSRTAQDTVPAAARRFVFLFDRSITFTPEAFPTCARTTIDAEGVQACPPGSRVGSGRSTAFDGSGQDVLLFNSRVDGVPGALVVIPEAGMILEQTFARASAPYRRTHRWTLDEIVPPTPVPPGSARGNGPLRALLRRHPHGRRPPGRLRRDHGTPRRTPPLRPMERRWPGRTNRATMFSRWGSLQRTWPNC
ncbi:hypothetical protein [Actinomadura sp. WAC 06369]|uniref:hypothetical protein n=1 Tax=Actinomadura sp. WAC 06369 TaxID=2203193 RepID=UPI0010018E38|nr:hypothetical protein [Actinomadura sp. WAC 06369]RSN71954.1 hypothetical protein DMH08_00050 [Actinomadura sp. WAC 06369]